MKDYIFLSTGDAPDFGEFSRGEIREFHPANVVVHVNRGTLKEVSKLTKDECRRFFFEMNVNDLPDGIKVEHMQDLLILTKEAVGFGIDLPKKISLEKIKKLLNSGDESSGNNVKETKEDESA